MIETAITALGASGVLSTIALKSPELLKEIYGDLAKPGVAQVGKALEAVLGLGNTVLIPFRLLNETGKKAEQVAFEAIADKLKNKPVESINPIVPEIADPLLDRLASTSDVDLRGLYAELIAKAACEGTAQSVHPSFVNFVQSMAPDEARLIASLMSSQQHPFITFVYKNDKGKRIIRDLILKDFPGVRSPENMPLYISNLAGLGIVEIFRDVWLTDNEPYDSLFREKRPLMAFPDTATIEEEENTFSFDKGVVTVTDLGAKFITACT